MLFDRREYLSLNSSIAIPHDTSVSIGSKSKSASTGTPVTSLGVYTTLAAVFSSAFIDI